METMASKKKENEQKQLRNETIGLRLFRLRYTGIKHCNSYLNFEDDVLTAHLNGNDTGDINNSCDFARDLTKCIVSVLKENIAEHISKPLDATQKKRPVGLVCDKITPNKRTGHIAALILPQPENPLSEPFLCEYVSHHGLGQSYYWSVLVTTTVMLFEYISPSAHPGYYWHCIRCSHCENYLSLLCIVSPSVNTPDNN